MEGIVYAMALRSVEGVGDVLFKRLIEAFGSARAAMEQSPDRLEAVEGVGRVVARAITRIRDLDSACRRVEQGRADGAELICLEEEGYPPLLRAIADPPSLLYLRGDLLPADRRAVAVVGSRQSSPYGKVMAERLSGGLAANGFTIVSGGARGIDGFAHRAALRSGGRTIVVLGSGVDLVYPPEHERLFAEIEENGALLSELPPGSPPEPHRFPKRNRIISGLALGTVVVEATGESGSLITATLAAEQGREVFAVPGMAGQENTAGVHRLIRQGAKLTEGIDDILEELAPQMRTVGRKEPPVLQGEEERLYTLVALQPKHIDQLIEESRLRPQQVMGLLLALELKGAVQQMPGQLYAKL